GVCSERAWPYAIAKFAIKPPPACYREALAHQITAYARLETLDEMQACLAEGFPFVFGFSVYESFESERVATTGVVPMPKRTERAIGGHAVLAVGYDHGKERFLVRNSWGTSWGMKGYFTIPYAYLADRDLSDDFWTIRRAEQIYAGTPVWSGGAASTRGARGTGGDRARRGEWSDSGSGRRWPASRRATRAANVPWTWSGTAAG